MSWIDRRIWEELRGRKICHRKNFSKFSKFFFKQKKSGKGQWAGTHITHSWGIRLATVPCQEGVSPFRKIKTIHCGGLGSRGSEVGERVGGEKERKKERRGQGRKTTTSIRTAPRDLGELTAGSLLWALDPGPSLSWLIAGVPSLRQALFPPADFSSRCC